MDDRSGRGDIYRVMQCPKFINFGGDEVPAAGLEGADIVVLPLCYEQAVSYGTGSKEGPFHILDASVQLESMDEESLVNWGEFRIHTAAPLFPPGDPETAVARMEAVAADMISRKKFLLSLGGDHAVSIGPIRAAARQYPDIGVLQFDAHLDLREKWNGSRFNHACVMRRVVEDMGVPVVQVGIRSFSTEEADYIQSKGLKPFFAHRLDPADPSWIQEVVDRLPRRVYVTIDLDGLDPSVLPGTGTPEPGGLSYRQLVGLIKAVGRQRAVIAADITELAPVEGSHVSEFTAAKIATKIFVSCPRVDI
ncbi:MAG: agmatinase [Thermodesulfobacteriota bacterium]